MSYIFGIIKVLIISYILIALLMYVFQRKLIYFPPKGVDDVGEKKIEINNNGVVLRGWVLNEGKEKAVLYYGGNAERIEYNIPLFKEIFKNYTVYLMNYRGYGISDGTPTEANFFKDAVYIYDQIKGKYDKISLLGTSIGSSVAAYVASKRPVDKLALVVPFDSIENVAKQKFWMFPISTLMKDKYQTAKFTKDIKAKTLIVVAEDDEIIPRKRTDALISVFNPKILTVKIIKGVTHNTFSMSPEYSKDLIQFFK